jgi:ATP-dependent exoDNAse (exonuclease V) beta subunit
LEEHDATATVQIQAAREELRLLYVGWTRARDRIVLADRQGHISSDLLQLLHDGKQALVTEPADKTLVWAGRNADVVIRQGTPLPPQPKVLKAGVSFLAAGPKVHAAAFVQPSAAAGSSVELIRFERIGERIGITGDPDWSALGMAVHGILCADRPGLPEKQREQLIHDLLSRWGVASMVDATKVTSAADAFRQWVDRNWPGAEWCREWPVHYRDENGSVVRGSSDLALKASGGLVVIDHKSFPGSLTQALARAAEYTGQLMNYSTAIEAATGQQVLSSWVHLPVSGIVIPLPR